MICHLSTSKLKGGVAPQAPAAPISSLLLLVCLSRLGSYAEGLQWVPYPNAGHLDQARFSASPMGTRQHRTT